MKNASALAHMKHDLHEWKLHGALIGQPRSRAQLNTPVLIVDSDALDRNIAAMMAFAAAHGVALRPHAKTHKSIEVARRQLAAGAVGTCCAKLGEAEVMAEAGIGDILITSPIASEPARMRLRALNERSAGLAIVVDHPQQVRWLSAAMGSSRLQVLIDVDPGIHRTGVASPDAAVELLRCITDTPNLVYRGVQYYCGLQQHIVTYAERRAAVEERTSYLQSVIAALSDHGGAPAVITGGGTGSHRIDATLGVLTEWQVGSYVFMDQQYAECELHEGAGPTFEHALFVDARVISANTPGLATVDAGFKALSTDGGIPMITHGASAGASYVFMGDEHGLIVDPERAQPWQLDDRVSLAPPHCDPTVNLYDAYHLVRDDVLIDVWRVSARGRSR